MSRLIGLEGSHPPDAVVVWAAGVIERNGLLFNGHTRRTTDFRAKYDLERKGSISLLLKPVDLGERHQNRPIVVVRVLKRHPHARDLTVEKRRIGGYVAKHEEGVYVYHVLASPRAFQTYAEVACNQLLQSISEATDIDDAVLARVDTGLSLDHENGVLNAIDVAAAATDCRDAAEAVAVALLESNAKETRRFQKVLAALTDKGVRPGDNLDDSDDTVVKYDFKYVGGIAEGGGLDIDHAANTLDHFKVLRRKGRPEIDRDYAFLKVTKSPPPRIWGMKAASATFTFVSGIQGATIGARIGRYLELSLLEDVLGGEIPDGLEHDRKFVEALHALTSPDPQTSVVHRRTGAPTFTPVSSEPEDVDRANDVNDVDLSVLGYQSGLVNDGRKIEVRFFPNPAWRKLFDSGDDGLGEAPEGAELLSTQRSTLFVPAIFGIRRRVASGRKVRYFLRSVVPLTGTGSGLLSALPSAVRDGVWVTGKLWEVERIDETTLRVGHSRLELPRDPSGPGAMKWLKAFYSASRATELAEGPTGSLRWIASERATSWTALERILSVLVERTELMAVEDLLEELNDRFEDAIWKQNTLREVRKHTTLIREDSDGGGTVALTEEGRAHAAVLSRIRAAATSHL